MKFRIVMPNFNGILKKYRDGVKNNPVVTLGLLGLALLAFFYFTMWVLGALFDSIHTVTLTSISQVNVIDSNSGIGSGVNTSVLMISSLLPVFVIGVFASFFINLVMPLLRGRGGI